MKMNPKFVLATLFLLAPAVYGCLVFQATLSPTGCDAGTLYSAIVDNGVTECALTGTAGSDSLYHYACTKETYSAYFDASTGILMYSTDHGLFEVAASNPWGVDYVWAACKFGCQGNGCWLKTESLGEACAPAPTPV